MINGPVNMMLQLRGLRYSLQIVFFVALAVLGSARCQADLLIRIDDATIQAGSVGSIDVWVRSDSSDTFSLASFMLRIDPITQVGGALEFQASFDDGVGMHQNNLEQFDPDYLFAGNTVVDNFFAARQDPVLTQLVGTDESSTGNVTINSPEWYLLGRVELQHTTPTPLTSRGRFRVSLIADPANTYFQNFDLDDFDLNQPRVNPISFSLDNAGVVRVVSVPEPSLLVIVVGVMGLIYFKRQVRRCA